MSMPEGKYFDQTALKMSNRPEPQRQTCKFLRQMIQESALLQYHMALHMAGYIDGPSAAKLSTAERLRRLRMHQEAWKDIKWRQADTFNIDGRSGVYELYGGVYATGIAPDRPRHTRGFEFVEFPSLLRNQSRGHTWKIGDVGFDIKDFGMDPDMDLLILMERVPPRTPTQRNPPCSVHLLSLRDESGRDHPNADVPILRYQPTKWHRSYSYWVQVVGDLLAILFRIESETLDIFGFQPDDPDEMVIWEWKTGRHRATIRFQGVTTSSFSFLSREIILVPCAISARHPVLRLYRLQDSGGAECVAQFGLPPLQRMSLATDMVCRGDPAPWAREPRNPFNRKATRGSEPGEDEFEIKWPAHGTAPFAPHPQSRLIVLSIRVMVAVPAMGAEEGMILETRSFTLFFKAQPLIDAWMTRAGTGAPDSGPIPVPWKEWGPSQTRLLMEATDTACVCYVYGLRYCRLLLDENNDVQLRVMDFNDTEFGPYPTEANNQNKANISGEPSTTSLDGPGPMHLVDDDGDENWTDAEGTVEIEGDSGVANEDEAGGDEEEEGDPSWPTWHIIPGFGGFAIASRERRKECEQAQMAKYPSYVDDREVFTERLETGLRFRWTMRGGEKIANFDRVMIDDEHIIGLRRSRGDNPQRITIERGKRSVPVAKKPLLAVDLDLLPAQNRVDNKYSPFCGGPSPPKFLPPGVAMAQSANSQSKAFDFTKRKRWADLLVTELSGVAILVLTSTGRIMFCGPAAKELLNWADDVLDLSFKDLLHPEDDAPFFKQFQTCILDPSEMAIFVRLKNQHPGVTPGSKEQYPLYEVKGHPRISLVQTSPGAQVTPECDCFFLMARPYPSRNSATLDSFLELKLENERLRQKLMDLRSPNATHFPLNPALVAASREDSLNEDTDADTAYNPPAIHGLPMPLHARSSFGDIHFAGPDDLDPERAKIRQHNIASGAEDTEDNSSKKRKRKGVVEHRYVCVTCGRTDSPEWRKGPLGPKTLCNACGLRHSKRTKKKPDDTPMTNEVPLPDMTDPSVALAYSAADTHAGPNDPSGSQLPPPMRQAEQASYYPVAMPVPISVVENYAMSSGAPDTSPPMPPSHNDLPRIQTHFSQPMGDKMPSSSMSSGYYMGTSHSSSSH
ncbi:blue light receptor [Tulasnella sp. 403]|nr:blue light receptor [Tulasnella sp. 403]